MVSDIDISDSAGFSAAVAALGWQVELGADEAILDEPLDRYALEAPVKPTSAAPDASVKPAIPAAISAVDAAKAAVAQAEAAAGAASDIASLEAALAGFDGCDLKRGARSLVFGDGDPGARVMIVGDAPNREDDRAGRPFTGQEGTLLDKMFDAIGLARAAPDAASAIYLTRVVPWRPPQDRDPSAEEIAMLLPFLLRHIVLANPEVLVVMGNTAAKALLGKTGMTRLRGQWAEFEGIRALPIFAPDHLLRQPEAKREAWADLLTLKAHLE